jgi:hypothetical protein
MSVKHLFRAMSTVWVAEVGPRPHDLAISTEESHAGRLKDPCWPSEDVNGYVISHVRTGAR